MTTSNRFRAFLIAITAVAASLSIQPVAFAAPPTDAKHASLMHDSGKCKHYVHQHYGHPSKGVDVVYVGCALKR